MLKYFCFFLLCSGVGVVSANGHYHGSGHHSHMGSHSNSGMLPFQPGCANCECQEYKNLLALENPNSCVDENRVFVMLKALDDISYSCRQRIIEHLDDLHNCFQDSEFQEFFNYYFHHHHAAPYKPPPCRTHHAIWKPLRHVHTSSSTNTKSCQSTIIDHVGQLFQTSDPCTCTNSGNFVSVTAPTPVNTATETTTTTKQPLTTTTTTTVTPSAAIPTTTKLSTRQHVSAITKPTTTNVLPPSTVTVHNSTWKQPISVRWTCGKLSTIESIALQHHLNQTSTAPCDPGNHGGSDEALVLVNCNVPDPSQWKQGVNVMQQCHDIPTYTPVATFIGGRYHVSMAESGIFLGCINDGFKLGVQHCNSTPTIDHIFRKPTTTLLSNDIRVYIYQVVK